MSKSTKLDVNQLLLKGYRQGVKYAIELASKTNTSLIVEKNGKIMAIKPKYTYVKVSTDSVQKKTRLLSRKKNKK